MDKNNEKGIQLLENNDIENAKKHFLNSAESGEKKALYYLRKIRNKENIDNKREKNYSYKTIQSNLGYKVAIPDSFKFLDTINDKYFDTITIEKDDDFDLYNLKTQGFLIEIPNDCLDLISIDSIINHMQNINEVMNYESENTIGKIVKTKHIYGIVSYTLITKGYKGIYQFKMSVDEFLENEYTNVIHKILNSFKCI